MGNVDQAGSKTASVPAHEIAYRTLRHKILFGELAPGQPVTILGLTEQLGAGMTPVREAIRRLIAEGALDFQGNRRVCVPRLTRQSVEELVFARLALEPRLAELACARADQSARDELMGIDQQLDKAMQGGDISGYLMGNYKFHHRLYDLANAPILASMADSMWLRFGPSLRVVCGRYGTVNLPDNHKILLAAMQEGDASATAQAMRADIEQGMNQLADSLGSPDSI
ncbi:GntR family transcriptional regulator [Donghicola sp. C2-DW-16]|uniref:GntR family transcriptional regulator n=1 Tax=Donghicola mangrovi TaxID=2729614 RepID=A0A850Q724_9RHOB|nr:GntR family transcriptional regulator [Donghicola mangrovi]NVO22355.1 GntR family transcriptional regulator [Donghicola mangrovi]NVO26054.1 GntR family transcriptional regulator [Donghicola mangrovi]